MEKISWTNRVKKKVILRVKEGKDNVHKIRKGRVTGLVISCLLTTLLKER
jgi:hypothetical protein